MSTVTEKHIAEVMQRYVDAITAGDVDAVLALYSDDAIVEDPVGSEPKRGQTELRVFYEGACESVERMVLEGSVRARGRQGVAAMIGYIKGANMMVETVDVMAFNDEGKVTSMTAYWGDNNLKPVEG